MSKVIVVNGKPASGKSTFVDRCIEYLGEDKACWLSTVDYPKTVAMELGWDGSKTPEMRKWLSDCKDLFSQFGMLWQYNARLIDELSLSREAIFIFSREPYEIKKFVDYFDAITVFVKRDSKEQISNHADADVENFCYDAYIDNNGTLEELDEHVKDFCVTLLGE